MTMSRDTGQSNPSRCFAECEREQFQERIALLKKVAEAATEWFGPSLQDARFETVAIIKALREAGYTYTTQEESK
jgi:DNA invertase Pin-like site-specific DNA recombinase